MRTHFKAIFLILAFALALPTNAAYEVKQRDLKLPSQNPPRRIQIANAVLADADRILNDNAGGGASGATVSSFLAQPDVCRVITVTPGGTTADVGAGDITITGTNAFGETITDTITLTANQSTLGAGTKAFCAVTSIAFPAEDSPYGATFDVGVSDKLGLDRCMDGDAVLLTMFAGAYEGTRPTVTYDADEVEKNTVDINGTLDGAKDIDLYFLENYACAP